MAACKPGFHVCLWTDALPHSCSQSQRRIWFMSEKMSYLKVWKHKQDLELRIKTDAPIRWRAYEFKFKEGLKEKKSFGIPLDSWTPPKGHPTSVPRYTQKSPENFKKARNVDMWYEHRDFWLLETWARHLFCVRPYNTRPNTAFGCTPALKLKDIKKYRIFKRSPRLTF